MKFSCLCLIVEWSIKTCYLIDNIGFDLVILKRDTLVGGNSANQKSKPWTKIRTLERVLIGLLYAI